MGFGRATWALPAGGSWSIHETGSSPIPTRECEQSPQVGHQVGDQLIRPRGMFGRRPQTAWLSRRRIGHDLS